jgi:prepilin-type N-terminal cleavage/methylation domain-containing protein
MRKQTGFTLIEIAIVLVIIGLLLGGVLKGQELITAARVRNLAAQQDGVKIAYLGFQDRYRALPGDYSSTLAGANIPGPTATLGCTPASPTCQNGKIDPLALAAENEPSLAWHQLSRSGFITGSYDGSNTPPSPLNNPTNAFSGYLILINDNTYSDALTGAAVPIVLNIKTGNNVPAAIVAELDRKVDDGNPLTGAFRNWKTSDGTTTDSCLGTTSPISYNATDNPKTCGGVSIQ